MKTKGQVLMVVAVASAGFFLGEAPVNASTFPSQANSSAAVAVGPRIQFDSRVLDFGKAAAGRAIEHNFMFTNTGDQMLQIKDVRPTCGCTVAGEWTHVVAPGRTGTIPIRYTPARLPGQVVKTVIVECNDPAQGRVVLQLKGTIWEPVEVKPLYVVFAVNADCPTNQTRVVRIESHLDQPLVLSQPECASRAFQTSLKTVRPGKEFDLQITLAPPLRAGTALAPVTLKTSYTNLPVINVTAYAAVRAAVTADPAQITLSPGPLPSGVEAKVTIQNNDAKSLNLSKPEVNAPGVDVRLREMDPGRRFILMVNFPAGFEIKRGQSIQLQVETNNPKFPILTVPVFQSQHLAALLKASAEDPVREQPARGPKLDKTIH